MARRPRPTNRAPPQSPTTRKERNESIVKKLSTKPKAPVYTPDSDSEAEETGPDNFVQGSSKDSEASISGSGSGSSSDSDEDVEEETGEVDDDEQDADAPRIVQWVDEDDLKEDSEEEIALSKPEDLTTLQDTLSSLPFGSLGKAQRSLAQASMETDDENDDSDDDAPPTARSTQKVSEKPAQEWSIKPRHDIAKRANKHAPQEVTSKRPVTRHRQVVEVPKIQARDPRFQTLSGNLDEQRFASQYGFLSDLRSSEHKELRENLKRARKRLTSSPQDTREERQEEVNRLEQALKRAESDVNRDKREKVEREALEKMKKEEREKRQQGKGAWYMRDAEKKDMLIKARYNALAESGGRGAVRKAIERKQKKIGQKEKRSRPYAARANGEGGTTGSDARKRAQREGPDGGWPKRQRTT